MLTALVVDDSTGARHRVGTMLHLGGWRVHQAIGTDAALRVADEVDLDLVVTDIEMRDGHGADLLHRLRDEGCRARSIVVAARPTELVRIQAAAVGALACLAKPVDPRLFLDLMHGLSGRPVPSRPAAPGPATRTVQVEAERLDRMRHMNAEAADGRRESAGTGRQSDALRNVLSHERLRQVLALSVAHQARAALGSQATPPA